METSTHDEKDQMLWRQAKKRVSFKKHLFVYLVINAFVWTMYFFKHMNGEGTTGMQFPQMHMHRFYFHGPVFMTLGWGIGLAFHYYSAYIENKSNAVEREYDKLKNSGK